jgi:hypothetical protein
MAGGTSTPAAAQSATTTTIQFDTPAIADSADAADLSAAQYLEQGIEFVDTAVQPVSHPINVIEGGTYLFKDAANARSGKQVLASYRTTDELLESEAGFLIHFTKFASKVSLYAGATAPNLPSSKGGAAVQMTGYDEDGNVVATTSVTVASKVDTLVSIDSAAAKIAYPAVQIPGYGSPRLEVDDLSFVTPAGSGVTTMPSTLASLLNDHETAASEGAVSNLIDGGKTAPLIVPKILSVSQGVGNPVTIVGDKPFADASIVYFGKTPQPGISVNGDTISVWAPTGMLPGSNPRVSILLKNASGSAMAYSNQTSEIPIGEVDVEGPIPDDPDQLIDRARQVAATGGAENSDRPGRCFGGIAHQGRRRGRCLGRPADFVTGKVSSWRQHLAG